MFPCEASLRHHPLRLSPGRPYGVFEGLAVLTFKMSHYRTLGVDGEIGLVTTFCAGRRSMSGGLVVDKV